MGVRRRGARGRFATVAVVAASALLLAACGDNGARYDQNALDPRGPDARKILDLFTPFLIVAFVIGAGVLIALFYAAFRFRAKPGDPGNPKQVHGHTGLEIGWTVAPALILVAMAVPTVALVFDLDRRPEGDVVEITVTGKQWWWEYEYTGEGFVTANEMHIPVDTPVYLTLESDNVIHSFWVPNLAGKKDVVPGRTHHLTIAADEPGLYLGQCAEYCGLSHANMRLRVIAEPREEYDAWVERMREPLSGAAAEFVADREGPIVRYGCTACHAFAGVEGATGRIGPDLTHFASRETFAGATFELDEENLRRWIRNAPAMKPNEWRKNVGMPPFPEMTDRDLDALVQYLLERE